MNQVCFVRLDKDKIEDILPQMFEILYENMSAIAPTGNSMVAKIENELF